MRFEVLLPGFSLVSDRGYVGWCNIVLLRKASSLIIYDTGHHSDRALLLRALAKRGIKPADIDLVIISHPHFDHCLNAHIFENAKILIGEADLDYVLSDKFEDVEDTFIPKYYIEKLRDRLKTGDEGDEIVKGVSIMKLPGHTPSVLGLLLEDTSTVLASDAVRDAWEFLRRNPSLCFYDKKIGIKSMNRVAEVAKTIIPGHDKPFRLVNGHVEYGKGRGLRIAIKSGPGGEWLKFGISAKTKAPPI